MEEREIKLGVLRVFKVTEVKGELKIVGGWQLAVGSCLNKFQSELY